MPKGIHINPNCQCFCCKAKRGEYKGRKLSKEHKRKLSESKKGVKNPMYNIGKNHPFYGKHHTKKAKIKISEAGIGRKHTEETKQKIRKKTIGEKNLMYGLKAKNHPRWKGGTRQHYQKLSRKVWEEYHNRKIPIGGIIHHKDTNYKNTDPKNLELIESNPRHIHWHYQLKKLKERTEKFLNKIGGFK